MVTDELCTLLVCSVSGERLRLLGDDEVADLNQRIAERSLLQRTGEAADRPIDGGLLAARSGLVYPIRDDLPYLLPEDAIHISRP